VRARRKFKRDAQRARGRPSVEFVCKELRAARLETVSDTEFPRISLGSHSRTPACSVSGTTPPPPPSTPAPSPPPVPTPRPLRSPPGSLDFFPFWTFCSPMSYKSTPLPQYPYLISQSCLSPPPLSRTPPHPSPSPSLLPPLPPPGPNPVPARPSGPVSSSAAHARLDPLLLPPPPPRRLGGGPACVSGGLVGGDAGGPPPVLGRRRGQEAGSPLAPGRSGWCVWARAPVGCRRVNTPHLPRHRPLHDWLAWASRCHSPDRGYHEVAYDHGRN